MKKLCAALLCLLLAGLCACGQTAPEAPTTPTTEPTTDYFEMVWGWHCPENAFASYIDEIYHTESGTAGNSGKVARSAVALLALCKAYSEDQQADLATAFAAMNDAQARFFGFAIPAAAAIGCGCAG